MGRRSHSCEICIERSRVFISEGNSKNRQSDLTRGLQKRDDDPHHHHRRDCLLKPSSASLPSSTSSAPTLPTPHGGPSTSGFIFLALECPYAQTFERIPGDQSSKLFKTSSSMTYQNMLDECAALCESSASCAQFLIESFSRDGSLFCEL